MLYGTSRYEIVEDKDKQGGSSVSETQRGCTSGPHPSQICMQLRRQAAARTAIHAPRFNVLDGVLGQDSLDSLLPCLRIRTLGEYVAEGLVGSDNDTGG